jgi:hypothetical protein
MAVARLRRDVETPFRVSAGPEELASLAKYSTSEKPRACRWDELRRDLFINRVPLR